MQATNIRNRRFSSAFILTSPRIAGHYLYKARTNESAASSKNTPVPQKVTAESNHSLIGYFSFEQIPANNLMAYVKLHKPRNVQYSPALLTTTPNSSLPCIV